MHEDAPSIVLDLVSQNPGEFSSNDLVRKLRSAYASTGEIKPKAAQAVIEMLIQTGQIIESVPSVYRALQIERKACYPKGYPV